MEAVLAICLVIGVSAGWLLYKRRNRDTRLLTDNRTLRLNGGSTFQYPVIGASRYQPALKRIAGTGRDAEQGVNAQATLIQEAVTNKDPVMVRVEIDGAVVGFLPRDVAQEYRLRLIDAGYPDATAACRARVTAQRSSASEVSYSVRLDLPPHKAAPAGRTVLGSS